MRRSLHRVIWLALFTFTLSHAAKKVERCSDLLETALDRGLTPPAVLTNSFMTNRNLNDAYAYLGESLARRLLQLGENDHWIDLGAGDGGVTISYLYHQRYGLMDSVFANHTKEPFNWDLLPVGRARITNIAAVKTLKAIQLEALIAKDVAGGHYRYLDDRYFEDIPSREIGRADLITDIVGVLSYTSFPDLALAKALNLLKVNGEFMAVTGSQERTLIRTADGDMTFADWLSGFFAGKPEFDFRVIGGAHFYITRRRPGAVRIPKLKWIGGDPDIAPPLRIFAVE